MICSQSLAIDLREQIAVLVDTVSQMSVLVETLTMKVRDQNIRDIQQQFGCGYEQRHGER